MYRYIVLALFFLCGCSSQKVRDPSGERPLVIVSIPPYIDFVKRIAGDTVSVMTAVPLNADPHVYEITPKRINDLSSALLWIGVHEHFEHKIIPLIQRISKGFRYVDLTTKVPLLKFSQDTTNLAQSGEHAHHHHEVHGNNSCCGKEGYDRHIWLSPKLAAMQARAIKSALTDLQPEFEPIYQANLDKFTKELDVLQTEIQTALRPYEGKGILINHAALGYFCHDFGLIQYAIETEGKELLPGQIAMIERAVKEHDIRCLFTLPQFENKGAKEIADQLNLKVVPIDPLKPDFIENMRYMTTLIIGCSREETAD